MIRFTDFSQSLYSISCINKYIGKLEFEDKLKTLTGSFVTILENKADLERFVLEEIDDEIKLSFNMEKIMNNKVFVCANCFP